MRAVILGSRTGQTPKAPRDLRATHSADLAATLPGQQQQSDDTIVVAITSRGLPQQPQLVGCKHPIAPRLDRRYSGATYWIRLGQPCLEGPPPACREGGPRA